MRFNITRHAAVSPPVDALDQLWPKLGTQRDQVSFARVGTKIRATWGVEASTAMTQDERSEIGRRVILEIVLETCDRSPELKSKWYAVSPDG